PNACALTTFIVHSAYSAYSAASFGAEGEQVPAEPPHPRARQRVEGADEEGVERHPLPAAVQPRLHREALLDDADVAKAGEERAEFAGAVALEHRGVLVLERHFHDLRQAMQPRHPVVDLEHGRAAWRQHPPALVDERPVVR